MTEKKVKQTKTTSKKDQKSTKISELKDQARALRDEVATLKLENEQRKLKNTTSLTLKRKELARLLTAMREVQLTNEENI